MRLTGKFYGRDFAYIEISFANVDNLTIKLYKLTKMNFPSKYRALHPTNHYTQSYSIRVIAIRTIMNIPAG